MSRLSQPAHRFERSRELRKLYGAWALAKAQGVARVRLEDGAVVLAEVHWYEAHGIGRRDLKIKYIIE